MFKRMRFKPLRPKHRRKRRLVGEKLEDRRLLTTFVFDNDNQNNAWIQAENWSIREADGTISNPNNAVPGLNDQAIVPAGFTASMWYLHTAKQHVDTLIVEDGAHLSINDSTLAVGTNATIDGRFDLGVPSLNNPDSSRIEGTGTLSINNEMRWRGGNLAITTAVSISGTLAIDTLGDRVGSLNSISHTPILTGEINNYGVINVVGPEILTEAESQQFEGRGVVYHNAGGTISNYGELRIPGEVNVLGFESSQGVLNMPGGVLTKHGSGNSYIGVKFENDGLLDVQQGQLALGVGSGGIDDGISSGEFHVGDGGNLASYYSLTTDVNSQFTGASNSSVSIVGGDNRIGGAYNIPTTYIGASGGQVGRLLFVGDGSNVRVNDVILDGGALGGTGVTHVYGDFEWRRGNLGYADTLQIAGTINLHGNTTIVGDDFKGLGSGNSGGNVVINHGTMTWTGAGELRSDPGGEWINEGTIHIQTDAQLGQYDGLLTLRNRGEIIKEADPDDPTQGIGAQNLSVEYIENAGTIELRSGELRHSTRFGCTNNQCGLAVEEGGLVNLAGGNLRSTRRILLDGGTLAGSGDVSAQVNASSGTISPGSSPGNLAINGNLNATGGSLLIEVAGPPRDNGIDAAGVNFDQIVVSGNAAIADLDVEILGDYEPILGDQYTVLTGSSVSGPTTDDADSVGMTVTSSATSIDLEVTSLLNAPPNADAGGPYSATEGADITFDASGSSDPDHVLLSPEDAEFANLINQFRNSNGLPSIPISASLTQVAQMHVRDLHDHQPNTGECNLHSWSANGIWTPVCYTADHAQASGMWDKPREITNGVYASAGYEIASQGYATSHDAVQALANNPSHNAVMLNQGGWSNRSWEAIGAASYQGYRVVWFGELVDPQGEASTPDVLTYEWDFDYDGTTFDSNATGIDHTQSFLNQLGPRTMALRVTDERGASDIATTVLQVDNVAPTFVTSGGNALAVALDENVATVTGSFVDPGLEDVHSLQIDWGDGSDFTNLSLAVGARTLTSSHSYGENITGADRTFQIEITVLDDGNGSDTQTLTLVQPPAHTADAGGPYVTTEGASIELDGSGSSPVSPALFYEWDLDYDGQQFDVDVVGVRPTVVFTDDFDGQVALRITSDAGEDIDVANVTVNNVAPAHTMDVSIEQLTSNTSASLAPLHPTMTLDGRRVAYRSAAEEVSIIDEDSGITTQSVLSATTQPLLSGDGTRLFYERFFTTCVLPNICSERIDHTGIYLADSSDPNSHPRVDLAEFAPSGREVDGFGASTSADGTRIVYQDDFRDGTRIVLGDVTDPANIVATPITAFSDADLEAGRRSIEPAISHDGLWVVFASNQDLTGSNADHNDEIFIYDVSNALLSQVTDTSNADNRTPSISEDGSRIVFRSNGDFSDGNTDGSDELFLFEVDTASFSQLTDTAGELFDAPRISANGERIVFSSTADLTGGNDDGNRELFLIDIDTHAIAQITDTAAVDHRHYAIGSDGTRLAFESTANLTGENSGLVQQVFVAEVPFITQLIATRMSDLDVELRGVFVDPGVIDSHTIQIAWGDGSDPVTIVPDVGARGYETVHRYPTNATNETVTYTIAVTVTDKDGGVAHATTTVDIFPTPTVIEGVKFNDINGNGARDAGEPGLAGWAITIQRMGPYAPFTVITDENGEYRVTVDSATYRVFEQPQVGWSQTLPGPSTERVSVASDGTAGDHHSTSPSISEDGRFVVFASLASNLVDEDSNGVSDVFLHDRWLGETIRVSSDPTAREGALPSYDPVISSDGRWVAFVSEADLIPDRPAHGIPQVYLYDRFSRDLTLASVGAGWNPANAAATAPAISADNLDVVVAFQSAANNLVANDRNEVTDIFWYSHARDRVRRASVDNNGNEANGPSADPSILLTRGGLVSDVKVAFESLASNLVGGDTNQATDVFIRHAQAFSGSTVEFTRTVQVSLNSATGEFGNGPSYDPSLEFGGVSYVTAANNLTLEGGNGTKILHHDFSIQGSLALSLPTLVADNSGSPDTRQGRTVYRAPRIFVAGGSRSADDVLLHDPVAVATTVVSVAHDGGKANRDSFQPQVSDEGVSVVFGSYADNLLDNDDNNAADIFVRDLGTPYTLSLAEGDQASNIDFGNYTTNPPPRIDPIDDVTLPDTSLGTTITMSGITDGGDGGQNISISIEHPTQLDFGPPSYDPTDGTAAVSVRPYVNLPGDFEVSVTLTDDGSPGRSTTTAFTIHVTSVNDPPQLNPNGEFRLDQITPGEVDNDGTLIADLLGSAGTNAVSDPDPDALQGIAIVSTDGEDWQYSVDDGTSWSPVGSLCGSPPIAGTCLSPRVRLLAADLTTRVRVIPTGNGAASFTFTAWDHTQGTNGENADPDNLGNSRSINSAAAVQFISDLPVATNQRPILDNSGNVLVEIDGGSSVADLIASALITDPDLNAKKGVAINELTFPSYTTIASGSSTTRRLGNWQFSTNAGATWKDVFTCGDSQIMCATTQPRLLAAESSNWIRYVGENVSVGVVGSTSSTISGTPSLRFRAWDRVLGNDGATLPLELLDLANSISLESEDAALAGTSHRPVLDDSEELKVAPVLRNEQDGTGTLITDLLNSVLGFDPIMDADEEADEGIAVASYDDANGKWQYSLNSGNSWDLLGPPTGSPSSRLHLLAADTATRIRFTPNSGFKGESTIKFHAWDQTVGVNGDNVPASSLFTTTAISHDLGLARVVVNNNRPVLDSTGDMMLDSIFQNEADNDGTSVHDLLASVAPLDPITDVDGPLEGIAIETFDESNGTWQYSLSNGSIWQPLGPLDSTTILGQVVDQEARLLKSNGPSTRVRFVPNVDFVGTASITFRAWDQESGVNGGTTFSSSYDGASSSLSENVEMAIIVIEPRDTDGIAPDVEDGAPNSGDGNNDGIPDSQQPHVASLPNASDGTYVTIVAEEGTTLHNVQAVTSPDPRRPSGGRNFPVGFFEYEVHGVPSGGTTEVRLIGSGVEDLFTYWKYGPEPNFTRDHYYVFYWDGQIGARNIGGELVLSFEDGRRGDDDLTKNGIIVDPGGPLSHDVSPWQNPLLPWDVNNDGFVSPKDALTIINELGATGTYKLGTAPTVTSPPSLFDVNGDKYVAPSDALAVINYLNEAHISSTEGEAPASAFAMSRSPSGSTGAIAMPEDESAAIHTIAIWRHHRKLQEPDQGAVAGSSRSRSLPRPELEDILDLLADDLANSALVDTKP